MDFKKIGLFILLTFAISWLVALGLYLFDVAYDTLLFTGICAILYMPAPAYATLILSNIYKKKLAAYGLEIKYLSLPWYLWTIVLVVGLLIGTFLIVGILGNGFGVDVFGTIQWSKEGLLANMEELSQGSISKDDLDLPMNPGLLLIIGIFGGILAGNTVILPFALGEELGWRGLMVHEMRKMGFGKANVLIGLIWGIWHAPLTISLGIPIGASS